MANALYPKFKEGLLNKEHNLNSDVVKVYLFDLTDDAYDAANVNAADLVAGAKVSTSGALGSPTITSGVFDSADFSFTAVTGDQSEALIGWNDTHANDALIFFFDTGVTGFPITPNGGDINVTVHASGWFSL